MFNGIPYEFVPMFWSLFFILGVWGLILVGRSIKEKSRRKELELRSRERIEAMQKGLPIPEQATEPPSAVELALADAMRGPQTNSETALRWFRTVALALGLFFLTVGIGMCAAFITLLEFREIWAIGMIPALGGVGLLLFYSLSADLVKTPSAQDD